MKDLYSAPRPPRKRRGVGQGPRSPNSGRFRAVEAIDDPEVFRFASEGFQALVAAAHFLEIVPPDQGDPGVQKMNAFVVSYLRSVAAAIAPHLVLEEVRPLFDPKGGDS